MPSAPKAPVPRFKTALVLAGGGMRAAFAAGVVRARASRA